MKLPFLDTVLWAAGPVLNAALVGVMCLRRRLRTFPVLASWCIFTVLSTIAHFFAYRVGSDRVYATVYWVAEGLDALLQIGVVAEVAHIVFHSRGPLGKHGTWLTSLIAVGVIAFAIVWWIHPTSPTVAGVWQIRGDLFTSLIVSGMFTLVLLTSQRLGFHWRSHVMSIGYGLMVWATVALVIGLLHGYLGRSGHYLGIEHARMVVYLSILSYWIVALWRDEPRKGSLSPEIQDAFLQVADRVSYDLAEVLGTREKESH
ncbi:MAG: hypothetical protein QOH35_5449 [Acidobacteriaceae bacterium]|nr:hypothetical protein [Acidobacteriaceae bacterium]